MFRPAEPRHPTAHSRTVRRVDDATPDGGAKKRKPRKPPTADVTLHVEYVSGPGSESLARTQYQAIAEVLRWLTDNPPPPEQDRPA